MKMVGQNWKTLDGAPFLFALCRSKVDDKKVIELVKHYILLENGRDLDSKFLDSKENTVLHIACEANKHALVTYLVDQTHCDPNKRNINGHLPLDMTTNSEVIKYLCKHDQVEVYSKTIMEWIKNRRSIDDATMLRILQSLVDTHRTNTKEGSTLLHVVCACSTSRDTKSLVEYLLIECQCDPNCLDSDEQTPIELTSDFDIMKTLVEHGAKMTANVVFKVISSSDIEESVAVELFAFTSKKGAMSWNPTDVNSNGYTAIDLAYTLDMPAIVKYLLTEACNPDDRDGDGYTVLHLACKADHPTTVNHLLSEAHCDPNIKSNDEEVPLQMTANPEIIKYLIRYGAKTNIMYESYKKALGTNKPIQPHIKVFIVGNPSVGKSTLIVALKKKIGIIARIFSGKVSGVDKNTIGIVPHDLNNKIFGRVTLYDFAGAREFYSGHAAFLQMAIESTPPMFLLVIDLRKDVNESKQNILYWISLLENQCTSTSRKPHIILVGSHADAVNGINPKDKVQMITDSLDTKYFTNMEYIGFVAMNCQYYDSAGMRDLQHLLIKSCQELRIHEPITFNAHCFLVLLIQTFMNLTAVTIKNIFERVKIQQSKEGAFVSEFLPSSIESLYKICLELNDRGHILLLKDRIAIENSYIVIDKEFLLSKISGAVFATEEFKCNEEFTNTGVVPLSNITRWLSESNKDPEKDLSILIDFLTHLEFCHEISDHSLHQLISEQHSQASGERYYLFPGLISLKADDNVWQMQSTECDYNFGWILKCIHLEQFFSSRFLQVLLLRLAYSFALEASSDSLNQSIGIHQDCHLWKNGIFWGSEYGMQTLVEVTTDNKSVILLARFRKANLLQCIHLRSAVISTILQCKEQFCPRVIVSESFVNSSSPLEYPLDPADTPSICSLQDLTAAVLFPHSTCCPAEKILAFEPYFEMELPTIQDLWDEKKENEIVENTFFHKFIQESGSLISIFSGSSMSSILSSENQLYQDLLRWRDYSDKTTKKTYKELRQQIDQYSVFAGRNVLKLVGKQPRPSKVAI